MPWLLYLEERTLLSTEEVDGSASELVWIFGGGEEKINSLLLL
jgi:hypothetical protein